MYLQQEKDLLDLCFQKYNEQPMKDELQKAGLEA
jgi:hypothetical protein